MPLRDIADIAFAYAKAGLRIHHSTSKKEAYGLLVPLLISQVVGTWTTITPEVYERNLDELFDSKTRRSFPLLLPSRRVKQRKCNMWSLGMTCFKCGVGTLPASPACHEHANARAATKMKLISEFPGWPSVCPRSYSPLDRYPR